MSTQTVYRRAGSGTARRGPPLLGKPCGALRLLVLVIFACSARSRLAPIAPASQDPSPEDVTGSMVVPYPPPPARIETVPPAPSNLACVYLDGQWVFGAKDWQWVAGGWVYPRGDCSFARGRLFWQNAGPGIAELRHRRGRWVQTAHPSLDCPAATPCS